MAPINRQRIQEAYKSNQIANPSRASGFVILNTNLATTNRGTATGVMAEAIWNNDLTDGASNHSNMIAVDVPTDARVFVPFYVCTATLTSIDGAPPCVITSVSTSSSGAGKWQIYGSVPVSSSFNQTNPSSIVTGAAPNYEASITVPVSGALVALSTAIGTYSGTANGAINNVAMFNQYIDDVTNGGIATTIFPVNFGTSTTTFYGSVGAATVLGSEPWGIPVNGLTRLTAAVLDPFAFTFTSADVNGTACTTTNARVMLGGFFAG